jgi:2-polyprenyl-3-methyl-5-hydroxy-6-metoxy-1,4-benzoquinol methylase
VSDPIVRQATYWNAQAQAFQQIYARDKPGLAGLLDRVFRRDMYERFEFAMEASEPAAGRTFLDVGCGSGVYCLELARRGAARVTGLDIADAMLDLCRAAAEAEGLGARCDFVRGELMQLNPEAPFDVTLGIGLFDYVADPLPLLRKMREVTRDRVILSFPRLNTWRAPVRWVRLSLRGCDVHFYTERRVQRLLADAGLRVQKFEQVGKLYCVVAGR